MRTAVRVPTLLVLDEFSSIAAVPNAAAKIRTALQHHYRDIGIVFAGSEPSVMRQLFTSRDEPFYGQADLVGIGPLSYGAINDIVAQRFASTSRDPGVVAARLQGFKGGHPQRFMQAADAVWHRTREGQRVTDEVWLAALRDLRQAVADPLSHIFDAHRAHERQVLRIVAQGESPHGAAGQLLGLAKATASRARRSLIDRGDLLDDDGRLVVTDPLLADWLRTTLPLP